MLFIFFCYVGGFLSEVLSKSQNEPHNPISIKIQRAVIPRTPHIYYSAVSLISNAADSGNGEIELFESKKSMDTFYFSRDWNRDIEGRVSPRLSPI